MSSPGDGTPPNRRIGEIAALISAITAVIGLLLAVFGVPLVGGSPTNRTVAGDAARATSSASASATASVEPVPAPSASSSPSLSPSPLPKGWHRVGDPDLTVAFALPNGWIQKEDNDIQNTWKSPDGAFDMSVKRDTSYGSTAQAASAGQLAWYRDTGQSSMAGLKAVTHTTRQNGRDALWLEIDYHWVHQSEPRKRVEVFVAGEAGRVYQLLVDTAATPEKLTTQRKLFTTARTHLLIDTNASSRTTS
ncbi:hypothetical protein AB0L71_19740 [Streptomyces sp. NPDC052052]|uniref:hypothetical protein n=1 Tax=Streptomyces sp. NPDC052052 TaxID=3154756 RepID=UPI00342E9771